MNTKYLFLLIIIVGIFLRTFEILRYPIQLGHDEVSQIYDAISIAETGRDVYGNFMPTMFISVHDFKSPFYTYATSLVYLLVGNHEWIIKVPGLLFSILMIPAVYLFTKRVFGSERVAFVSAAITTIAPFEVFYGRKSFENVIGIFFLLIGFYFLHKYIQDAKHSSLLKGLLVLGTGMYTYFSHAIIIPLLVFCFFVINKEVILKRWKEVLKGLLIWGLLIAPLLFIVVTNPGSRYRSQTVFITQDIELGRELEGIEGLGRVLKITDYSFQRYLQQFDFEYLFLNGLDLTHQGPLGSGPLMVVQFPMIILGVITLIRLKGHRAEKIFIVAWILIGMIPSGLTFEKFSPHRSIMVFTMFNIVSAVGVVGFADWVIKKKLMSLDLLKVSFVILFVLNFSYFWIVYTTAYPKEKAQELHYPFKDVALFAKDNINNVDQVVFDPKFGEVAPRIGTAAHYYLAYYTGTPVADFQRDYKLGDQEKREVLFDKYSIRAINWAEDASLRNVILIASPWVVDIDGIDKSKIVKTFYFPDKMVAFYAIRL